MLSEPIVNLLPQTADRGTRIVKGACPHDCPDTCALRVTVEDGRVVKVQGQPEHPSTHGALCTKVSRYPERTYHEERVLHPLKRVSAKHEAPRFERIGWDQAIAEIAGRLKAIAARDPQAILPYSYAGTMGLLQGEAMAGRFFNRLGASSPRTSRDLARPAWTARSARRRAARGWWRPTGTRSACTCRTSPSPG